MTNDIWSPACYVQPYVISHWSYVICHFGTAFTVTLYGAPRSIVTGVARGS